MMRAHSKHISKHQNSAFICVVNICIVYPTLYKHPKEYVCISYILYVSYRSIAWLHMYISYETTRGQQDTQINPGFSFFFPCSLSQTAKVKEIKITSTHCIFSLLFAYWNDPASCRTSTLSSLYLLWCNHMLCLALVMTIHAYSFMLHC